MIIAALCVVLALASGCSALRLGYNRGPDLAYWWLDRHVDFDDGQAPRVRDALVEWFAWHRRTQLPGYVERLASARTEVLADTDAVRVCEWQTELTRRVQTAFDHVVPAAAGLLPTLAPAQIEHLERRQAKTNAALADDFLQPDSARRAAAAFKRTVKRAESFYGELDEPQRAVITAQLAQSPFDAERWFAERRQRQQEAVALLRRLGTERPERERAEAALRAYAAGIERSPRDDYRRYSEPLKAFNCAFAARLHNATTAAQRRTAADKLAGWEADLRSLVAAGDPGF